MGNTHNTVSTFTIAEPTLRKWYDRLQELARQRYEKGWDFVVEAVSFKDFVAICKAANLDRKSKVIAYYREQVMLQECIDRGDW